MDVQLISDIIKFIPSELLIISVALGCIGIILKNTPKIADWLIPYILIILGILGSVFMLGNISVQAICYGILSGAIAVTGHQILKQTRNKN